MRIDRLLAITIMMLNRDRVTAKELSDKFEVSIRTIYRDLDAMLLAGIPVMSYQGNEGGYGLVENYKIKRQLLTIQDIHSILSALEGINLSLEDKQISGTIEKIRTLVPKEKKIFIDTASEIIVFDSLPWGKGKKRSEYLKILHNSILHENIIKFDYIDMNGGRTERSVEPMTLFFKGYGWYLYGYCLTRSDYRVFRLTRIKNLKKSDSVFRRRPGSFKDILEYDWEKGKKQKIILRFDNELLHILESTFEEEEINRLSNGTIEITTYLEDEFWILPYILSFGDKVEVIEPISVRNKIKEISKKIQKKYQT